MATRLHSFLLKFCAGLIAVAMGGAAEAATIFTNFGPGDSFSNAGLLLQGPSVGTIGDVDQAVQIAVGSNYELTTVDLGILVIAAGEIRVIVAADSVGLPGATLASTDVSAAAMGLQVISAAFSQPLSAGNYWIVADSLTTFDGGWDFNSIGDTGNTAGRSDGGPWNLRVDDIRFAVRLEGRELTTVPEPSTLALLGLALAGVARARRRGLS